MKNLLIVALVSVLLPVASDAQLIDNFSDGELLLSPTDFSDEPVVQDGLASVIGGERETYAATQNQAQLSIDTVAEVFNFSATEAFGYFELSYGHDSPLGIDLSAAGTAIQLDFESVTLGPFMGLYRVTLESPDAIASQSFAGQLFALPGSGKILLPLNEFQNNFGEIDFSNISTIGVSALRVDENSRLTLSSISSVAIPEPSSLTFLLASATVAIGLRGRKRDTQIAV